MRKKHSVREVEVKPGWYAPGKVLEFTIHMYMEPDGLPDGIKSDSDVLEALATIVSTAKDTGWVIKPRLIDFDESFYAKPICDW
jgi:hypothetical protein